MTISALLLGVVPALAMLAPSPAGRSLPRSFEVVSVRANPVGGESRRMAASPGGGFTAVNASLKALIARAYGVPEATPPPIQAK